MKIDIEQKIYDLDALQQDPVRCEKRREQVDIALKSLILHESIPQKSQFSLLKIFMVV